MNMTTEDWAKSVALGVIMFLVVVGLLYVLVEMLPVLTVAP